MNHRPRLTQAETAPAQTAPLPCSSAPAAKHHATVTTMVAVNQRHTLAGDAGSSSDVLCQKLVAILVKRLK